MASSAVFSLNTVFQEQAHTFGAFAALVYGLDLHGGYVGDHLLGTKRTSSRRNCAGDWLFYDRHVAIKSRSDFYRTGHDCRKYRVISKANPSARF